MITLQPQTKTFLLGLSISVLIITSFFGGAIADRVFVLKPLNFFLKNRATTMAGPEVAGNLGGLEVADVAEQASPAVVTVSAKRQQRVIDPFTQSIFGFGLGAPQAEIQEIQQDIGSGFVVENGLVVTNKHVVADPNIEYLVVDKDDREHKVLNIYRDPVNDLAILKVEGESLPALALGDSAQLRVGQSVIAIGTALGEFRHTVTTGVVSGLGRGIQAIGPTAGGANIEGLEGVIQTDAAINPGNSGGPLLNTAGEVIGVNVAVTAGAQNIGFAIPINVIKSSLDNFNQTGQFDRAYLGVSFRQVSEQAAVLNNVPQGAYVLEVAANSSASDAGIQAGDIITKFDDVELKGSANLAELINQRRLGDKVELDFWRNGQSQSVEVVLRGR